MFSNVLIESIYMLIIKITNVQISAQMEHMLQISQNSAYQPAQTLQTIPLLIILPECAWMYVELDLEILQH